MLNAARIAERLRKKLDKTWVALLTGAQSEDLLGEACARTGRPRKENRTDACSARPVRIVHTVTLMALRSFAC